MKIRSPEAVNKIVTAVLATQEKDAIEAGALAYMPRSVVMVSFPHSKPDGLIYHSKNGNFSLTMMANPEFGLPYGSLARLLIAWLVRQVKLTQSRVIYLGETFASFLREFNLSQSGGKRGDATYLRDQMQRLFTTSISWVYHNKKEGICQGENFPVANSFQLWWDPVKITENQCLFHATITLSEEFYKELMKCPIPVDFRVLQALRRSPLQIDIYVWLTYRLPYLECETFISWKGLRPQFGANYANSAQGLRDFKKQFLKALHIVQLFYEKAEVTPKNDGIWLYNSPPHIKRQADRRECRAA